MQTIYLDISNKGVVPTIYAKQGDVGRKFEVVFTDSGIPYSIPTNAKISIWYEGDSGVGNYTDIGENSAIAIGENKAVVELITQMLSEDGEGIVCLVMNAGNNQIGSWNIRYLCERVPGFDSEGAKEYYTAFSKTVESLKQVTENLTPEAIGAAPGGYGYGESQQLIWWDDSDGTKLENYLDGFFTDIDNLDKIYRFTLVDYPACVVAGQGGYADIVCTDMTGGTPQSITIVYYAVDISDRGMAIATKKKHSGVWRPWEYLNPPMTPDVEYCTTERHNGKPVYVQLVNMLACPAPGGSKSKAVANAKFISLVGFIDGGNHHTMLPRFDANGRAEINVVDGGDTIWLVATSTASDFSSENVYVLAKYAKATD